MPAAMAPASWPNKPSDTSRHARATRRDPRVFRDACHAISAAAALSGSRIT